MTDIITTEDVRTSYGLFYLAMNPDFGFTHFQQNITIPALERIVIGDPTYKRVMNVEPFRHSKTWVGTLYFVPYYFGHHPEHTVILLCYGKTLARSFGRDIRNIMRDPMYTELFPEAALSKSSRAADEFLTVSGGKFFAGGFDTGVNGRGAQLVIIDDPHKNKEEAESELVINKLKGVFNNTIRTRCEPGAAILINTTRWNPNDMIGWRLEEDGGFDHFSGDTYVNDYSGKEKAA